MLIYGRPVSHVDVSSSLTSPLLITAAAIHAAIDSEKIHGHVHGAGEYE